MNNESRKEIVQLIDNSLILCLNCWIKNNNDGTFTKTEDNPSNVFATINPLVPYSSNYVLCYHLLIH